jgi:hypothetical protein
MLDTTYLDRLQKRNQLGKVIDIELAFKRGLIIHTTRRHTADGPHLRYLKARTTFFIRIIR